MPIVPKATPNGAATVRISFFKACVVFVSLYFASTTALHAQPASDDSTQSPSATPTDPPISISQALDNALMDLHIAEANGPDRKAAFGRVRASLEHVYRQDSANRRARFYNARLLILADRRDEALRLVEEWTQSPQGTNDWEGHFILGKLYAEGSYFTLAKPVLRTALKLNPRESRIHVELSKCEAATMNREASVTHARQAIAMVKGNASAALHVLLAQALGQNSELDEAQQHARQAVDLAATAIRVDGVSVPTLQTLDQCLVVSLQLEQQKLQANREAIELYYEISALILRRAEVAAQLADYQALDVAARGLQAAGDRPPERLFLHAIKLFMKLGINDQAGSLVRQMVELYPNNAEANELHRALAPPSQADHR